LRFPLSSRGLLFRILKLFVHKATWPKGVSGNPRGRPKGDLASVIGRAVFENNAEAIYYAVTRALLKGDPRVFNVFADRAYGKPKEQIEIDQPTLIVRLEAGRQRALSTMSDIELRERILELEQELLRRSMLTGENEPISFKTGANHATILYGRIISLSSCSRTWQCQT